MSCGCSLYNRWWKRWWVSLILKEIVEKCFFATNKRIWLNKEASVRVTSCNFATYSKNLRSFPRISLGLYVPEIEEHDGGSSVLLICFQLFSSQHDSFIFTKLSWNFGGYTRLIWDFLSSKLTQNSSPSFGFLLHIVSKISSLRVFFFRLP